MPVLDVKNLEGVTVGQIELADDVFGARVNSHLLHETVRHHLAAERAGTHKTKDKSEVSGSGHEKQMRLPLRPAPGPEQDRHNGPWWRRSQRRPHRLDEWRSS